MSHPKQETQQASAGYELFPSFPLRRGRIETGFQAIAEFCGPHAKVRVDGYVGIDWGHFSDQLHRALQELGVPHQLRWVGSAWRSHQEIKDLVEPFLGGDDPLFGTRCNIPLRDFFVPDSLEQLENSPGDELTIYFGCGAGLLRLNGPLIYVDLPKDALQERSRKGLVLNLGAAVSEPPKTQYKRFYFVDWPVLNAQKVDIHAEVDLFVDGQCENCPNSLDGESFRAALDDLSCHAFRVRPWLAPGPWGGTWLKSHIPQAPQDVPNYAWSFELISPENGIVLSDGKNTVEASFDWLMYRRHRELLGHCAERFGHEFPIRFDYLDTFDGGNLSVQCHPRPDYIRREFGESFTQDETYYILDAQPEAAVYLGFQEGVDPAAFRDSLEHSAASGAAVDVDRFIMRLPADKHGLYLIPNGTVHCSGVGNLVLEISATPYIFTFKMYDWLRTDLDGAPRTLNIARAFENLDFSRQGERVTRELVSVPRVISQGDGWRVVHLPTHQDHFYDVHRLEFERYVDVKTEGSPHVMMLVEGQRVMLEDALGFRQQFSFAETFVVPANTRSYRLMNLGSGTAKIVKAFIKP
jgi:mannose-6-phosphate isomerase class I